MAKNIADLRTTNTTGTTSRQYLLVSDLSTRESTKIALNEVFPSLQSGKETGSVSAGTAGSIQDLFVGGGAGTTITNTNKSTLIFKGLKPEVNTSGSQSAAFELRTDTSTADPNKRNLVLALNINKIDLIYADNTTSGFLATVAGTGTSLNLSSGGTHFSGTLGVGYGGTGITSGAAGDILHFSGSTTIDKLTFRGKGQLMVAQQLAAPTALNVGSNGQVLKADSSTTSGLAWGDVTFAGGTMTGNIDMSNNDIDMGTGYLSGSGSSSQGLRFDATNDHVFIGDGTFYNTGVLNVNGNIHLGTSAGGTDMNIVMKPTSSGASANLGISGSSATGTGNAGGTVTITGGAGDTNGNGGNVTLSAGLKAGSGTDGSVVLQTGGGTALNIDQNKDVNIKSGSLVIDTATEGIVHKGSGTVTQATNHTTAVTINATSGVIQLAAVALAAANNAEFTVTNSAVQADSVIILTVLDENTTNNAQLTACTHTIAGGSFKISVFNPAATGSTSATASKIHFLIINNSV